MWKSHLYAQDMKDTKAENRPQVHLQKAPRCMFETSEIKEQGGLEPAINTTVGEQHLLTKLLI